MNEPYLFDSSTWINHFHKRETKSSQLLFKLLDVDEEKVLLCPPVVQEILQGLKYKEQFLRISYLISSYTHLPCGHYNGSHDAAKIYFELRKKGITIRKPNDCLIAWYAMDHDLVLVHDDEDFEKIKRVFPLKTYN